MASENREGPFAKTGKARTRTGRFGSLGWRILLWMSLVAFLPLLIMASQGYHCARQAIYESQRTHLRSVLESRKARLEGWLDAVSADLRFLSIAPCIRGLSELEVGGEDHVFLQDSCEVLDHARESNASYKTIETYNSAWRRLAASPKANPPERDLLSSEFKAQLGAAKGLVIARATLSEDNGMDIHIGHPVFNSDGNRTAYIVARLKVSRTLDPIFQSRVGLGRGGKVYLLSGEGRYLYPPSATSAKPRQGVYAPSEIRTGRSSRVLEYTDDRGIDVLGTSSAIPVLNWTIVAEVDRKEAFAWLRTLRTRAVLTGSVTLVLVLLLAARSSSKLSRPLKELATISRKIAAGHHEERLKPLEGTEAREVSHAFNTMLDKLAASHRRLMQSASLAAVGELSSSTVHEMRNPLSSVKINLQALRKKVESDPAHLELATIALDQVARVENMLSDLLGYGKPLELNLSKVAFKALARDVLVTIRSEREARDVSVEIEDNLGSTEIVADAEQIRRALTNLVTNAIQVAPPGGKVRLAARLKQEDPGEIIMTVSDNGPGIAKAQRERLFKPFFTTRPGGTGLGLAITKKIVDYHDGVVLADNAPEGGAVFKIILPLGGPPV